MYKKDVMKSAGAAGIGTAVSLGGQTAAMSVAATIVSGALLAGGIGYGIYKYCLKRK